MNTPTSRHASLAWHRNAMAGKSAPIHEGEPHCGWFQRKLVKGGKYVPARIFLEQQIDNETGELTSDEVLCCEVNGESCDPYTEWTWLAGNPISHENFLAMSADAFSSQDANCAHPKYHF